MYNLGFARASQMLGMVLRIIPGLHPRATEYQVGPWYGHSEFSEKAPREWAGVGILQLRMAWSGLSDRDWLRR